MLRSAMQRGRVAASYLFAGEQGIGKRFAALNFAKALNCLTGAERGHAALQGESPDCCDACPSCRRIDKGSHPDFAFIAPEGTQIKVESIRRVEEMLSLKAYEARVKTVIVDDAEAMNPSAANAFLKTLEEPPPGSLIVLVSSSPDMLPPTIRSRCVRINFTPLSAAACESVLRKSADRGALARLSMGRPGLALKGNLLRESERFFRTIRDGEGGDGKHPWKDARDVQKWLDMALLLLRDMAVMKITKTAEALIDKDRAAEILKMGPDAPEKTVLDCYRKLSVLRNSLRFNPNRGITWNYANAVLGELKGK